jgi:hypothetical protein
VQRWPGLGWARFKEVIFEMIEGLEFKFKGNLNSEGLGIFPKFI